MEGGEGELTHNTVAGNASCVWEKGTPHLSAVCRYTEARYFSTASPTNSAASRLKGSQAGRVVSTAIRAPTGGAQCERLWVGRRGGGGLGRDDLLYQLDRRVYLFR